MSTAQWNPRYLHYARVHGEPDPERMLEKDREEWKGGCMAGFMIWLQKKWSQWYKETDFHPEQPKGQKDHDAFDAWLATQKK